MRRPVPLRDAATVVVLRSGRGGPEVLLLRRHAHSGFAADAWVFPGGTVDEADLRLPAQQWRGLDVGAAAVRYGRPPDVVLGLHVAAVRETFEEAGLLLATRVDGGALDLDDDVVAFRQVLAGGEQTVDWGGWLADRGLVLDLGCLTLLSRWQTPEAEPRRYDTAFFLARAPEGQIADHDRVETTGQRWLTPAEALAQRLRLLPPTRVTLERLAAVTSIEAAFRAAAAQPQIAPVLPHVFVDSDGRSRIVLPWDDEYPVKRYEPAR